MRLGITWRQQLGRKECPYAERWVLNLHFFTVRLHHFHRSDDARAFHDHPWWFMTLVLRGGYTDRSPNGDDHLSAGSLRFRAGSHQHTVITDPGGAWTVLLTGRASQPWGFWVHGKRREANKYFLTYGHHPCDQDKKMQVDPSYEQSLGRPKPTKAPTQKRKRRRHSDSSRPQAPDVINCGHQHAPVSSEVSEEDRELANWFAKMAAPSTSTIIADPKVSHYEPLPYRRLTPRRPLWHGPGTMTRHPIKEVTRDE